MGCMPKPFKHPKTGTYYYRRGVPLDLRPLIGKREWKVSLQTKDFAEARVRHSAEAAKCEELFAAARDQLAGRPRLLASDAPKLADRWARAVLAEWEADPEAVTGFLAHVGEEAGLPQGPYVPADYVLDEDNPRLRAQVLADFIGPVLQENNLPIPDPADPARAALEDAFFVRWRDLCRMAFNRHIGDWRSELPLPAAEKPLAKDSTEPRKETSKLPRLSEAFEAWAKDKRLDKDSDKTIAEFRSVIARFTDLFGDKPLDQINRPLCFEFADALGKMPTKGEGIRGLSARDAITKAAAEGLPTAGLATVKKQLRALSAVLGFAMRRFEGMTEEPVAASGLIQRLTKSINKAQVRDDDEKDYSREELKAIFSSPLYTSGWQPPVSDFGQALYWLPLLMIYTGARREELAQMDVADVQQDAATGVWFLFIRPGEDKSIKTLSSRRKVPLHDDLLALGFIDYVQSLSVHGRLFPKLERHPSNGYGHAVGKAWAKYLREVAKIDSQASPSHGFRHTFKTLCREAGIPKEVGDWLTGHASRNVGDTYGTNPLSRMADELKKFPSIAKAAGVLKDTSS